MNIPEYYLVERFKPEKHESSNRRAACSETIDVLNGFQILISQNTDALDENILEDGISNFLETTEWIFDTYNKTHLENILGGKNYKQFMDLHKQIQSCNGYARKFQNLINRGNVLPSISALKDNLNQRLHFIVIKHNDLSYAVEQSTTDLESWIIDLKSIQEGIKEKVHKVLKIIGDLKDSENHTVEEITDIFKEWRGSKSKTT